jgi:hypothetical protein
MRRLIIWASFFFQKQGLDRRMDGRVGKTFGRFTQKSSKCVKLLVAEPVRLSGSLSVCSGGLLVHGRRIGQESPEPERRKWVDGRCHHFHGDTEGLRGIGARFRQVTSSRYQKPS